MLFYEAAPLAITAETGPEVTRARYQAVSQSFEVDLSRVGQMAEELATLSKRGIPYAIRDTLNGAAFAARAEWQERMRKTFTLRNHWTLRSVQVEKVGRGIDLSSMQSKVGSVAPYVERQESGGTERSKGKHGVPIPTTSAAGMAMRARGRTKVVQRKNWQTAIHLKALRYAGSQKRQNAIAVREAAKSGSPVFLDLGKRKGIFRVEGTPRRGARLRIRMIWDLSRKSVQLKPRPTLEPSIEIITRTQGPAIMERALARQFDLLMRHQGGAGPVRSVY